MLQAVVGKTPSSKSMVCGHGTQAGQHCVGSEARGLESPFYNGSWSMSLQCAAVERAGSGTIVFIWVGSLSGTHVTCSRLHGSQMIPGKGFSPHLAQHWK